ncbi:MAG TPA: zinc-ribbon domain containing protein, partial [Phytomonospora sp.]
MERSGSPRRGRLTGRTLLLGEGVGRHGTWRFRADGTGWALVSERDCVRGVRGAVDRPLTHEEAWAIIVSHVDGPAPPRLGPGNTAPLTVMTHPVHGDLPYTAGPGHPLPPGAVRADPARQNAGMWPVRHFYVDSDHTCVQCGAAFVLSAAEQRHWYEDLGLSF